MAKRKQEEANLDMTPMIDIVFQLIIFFILTINLNEDIIDPTLQLGDSPEGPEIKEVPPGTVTIEVDYGGNLKINQAVYSFSQLSSVMRNVANNRGDQTEVMIRGDRRASHEAVRQAMDACAAAGLWKIKFVAMKEKNT